MNWQDKGYLLSLNKYNENSSIAEFFTENNGKVVGVIFGIQLFQFFGVSQFPKNFQPKAW